MGEAASKMSEERRERVGADLGSTLNELVYLWDGCVANEGGELRKVVEMSEQEG